MRLLSPPRLRATATRRKLRARASRLCVVVGAPAAAALNHPSLTLASPSAPSSASGDAGVRPRAGRQRRTAQAYHVRAHPRVRDRAHWRRCAAGLRAALISPIPPAASNARSSPIVTGTSVLAIKYKDGVMLSADTLGASAARAAHPARRVWGARARSLRAARSRGGGAGARSAPPTLRSASRPPAHAPAPRPAPRRPSPPQARMAASRASPTCGASAAWATTRSWRAAASTATSRPSWTCCMSSCEYARALAGGAARSRAPQAPTRARAQAAAHPRRCSPLRHRRRRRLTTTTTTPPPPPPPCTPHHAALQPGGARDR